MSAPQRFLANDRNLVRTATLTPSDVQSVANSVIETPQARSGTAQLKITGDYTGLDPATYDFEIVDNDPGTKLVSRPEFSGVGSETLEDVVATSVAPQDFKVECHSAGQPAVAAAVQIEGVSIVARAAGVSGNGLHINVDVSGLTFTATNFSLIEDVTKGSGSEASPLIGPQYDWDTPAIGADDNIPVTATTSGTGEGKAHRIAFEGDESNVYLAYKKFVDNAWQYFTVPALLNDYAAGTRVLFVTGSYTVSIIDDGDSPPSTDTLPGIVTVYDFLNAVKTTSVLADVDGVIANDRSPTGQSSRDLALRTQARALLSTGEGSKAATGFVDVSVETDANTELITAECIAIDFKLDPHAFVGHEAWTLKGSVSGVLGTIYTGEPFVGSTFSLTIPQKLPPTSGNGAGTFSLTDFTRGDPDAPFVKVCFAGKLGPNAVDQTLTLVYTARPPPNCDCEGMPVPELNTSCLGGEGTGDTAMGYSADAQTRIDDLYDWVSDLAETCTRYIAGTAMDGIPESIITGTSTTVSRSDTDQSGSTRAVTAGPAVGGNNPYDQAPVETGFADVGLPPSFGTLIDQYDTALQAIDAVGAGALQTAGFTAWDDAVDALKGDLNTSELTTLGNRLASVANFKYQLMLKRAQSAAGITTGKSNASNQSGDGCWQDFNTPFYWKVTGVDGEYAPAFTNHAYWGSRKNDDGLYFSTHEFAFILNVACEQNLRLGDTITLTIGNAAALGTYQVDDVLKLPVIAAADQFLAGGIDEDNEQKWYVTGSVDGPFAVYTFDPDSSPPDTYSSGGISFQLMMGGVDPAAGDTFLFSVIGARSRWRKNAGSWSSPTAITSSAVPFDSGLSYQFFPGVEPSFVALDRWTFRALQQWSAENLKTPKRARWYPGVAASDVYAEFASGQTLDAVGIALHTIPEGATLTLEGGDTIGITDWTESITWRATVIAQFLSQTRTATWVRLNLVDAANASIGWLWVGEALQTGLSADSTPKLAYSMARGDAGGLYQGGSFLGKTINATVSWSEGALTESDVANLTAMLDHVKSNNDEAIIFVPQVTRPDAFFAKVVDDEIPLPDLSELNRDAAYERRHSASLTLQGIYT